VTIESLIAEPADVLGECFDDLAANRNPETILPRLRSIESSIKEPKLRAKLLHARAIATARLGFSTESLGDLQEALQILEQMDNNEGRAQIFRTLAVVHSWRGDCLASAMALLRAIAEATAAHDSCELNFALIEAARLHIEMGRTRAAQTFLESVLHSTAPELPILERQRAWVNLLQTRVASGRVDDARTQFDELPAVLDKSPSRLHMLSFLEWARILRLSNELDNAEKALQQAASFVPPESNSFEEIEIAHARAELLLSKGDFSGAALLVERVVSRYATDDLAGREIVARFLQAQVFDGLGYDDQAVRTLAAALRRALARGLSGYVDEARSRMAARGASQGAWRVGDAPSAVPPIDISGRFVRCRLIGTGGFGAVTRAYDLELGVEVALKRTRLSDVYDISRRRSLLNASRTEVAAASRIEHPAVARILGLLVEPSGDAYLVQEFVEGPTLRSAMHAGIERPRAFEILSRIAFALAAIHAVGVLHRDIKPENIILRSGDVPVLVDFGIAQLTGRERVLRKAGTSVYMSPEQAYGSRLDERSDLYSLGLIACELLIPGRPDACFGSELLNGLLSKEGVGYALTNEGVPAIAANLVGRLVSRNRFWRPRSATIVAEGFAEAGKLVSGLGGGLSESQRARSDF
jgi:tRNA A-37 threonylcarbamoyl transferase component Bud32/tetratricopeptide (TPR) repeat protein